jgi:uncharacterized protein YutE (UPF0331/DUF86 family)
MPDKDVVFAKVAAIQKWLRSIKHVTGLDPDRLEELDTQDIFVLNLQRAIQSAIDLATHIVASESLGLSDTIGGHFALLEKAEIITKSLSKKMQSMVGFRNIAIHDYQALDPDILKAILCKNLVDLEHFYTAIVKHFKIAEEGTGGGDKEQNKV